MLRDTELRIAEGWMREAARVAEQALCLKAKCGTVIVKDEKIIGEGYNAPPQNDISKRKCLDVYDLPQKFKYDRTCCLHAEWRAIMDALARTPLELKDAALYFTRVDSQGKMLYSGMPYCTECSRMAFDSGIAHFLLWHEGGLVEYPTDEYNDLSYAYNEA